MYLVVCRLFAFLVLLAQGDRSKELEILVLRHELVILRRQVGRLRFEPHDRLVLAALSRVAPRRCWSAFRCARRRCCAGTSGWLRTGGRIRIAGRAGHRSSGKCGS
jgi:hypothetical protein